MNIAEIKAAISANEGFTLGTMNFVRQFEESITEKDASGKPLVIPTEWVSHWDNDHRVRISMHEDVMARLKEDTTLGILAVKREVVTPVGKAPYVRYIIITPRNIDFSI